MDVQTFLSNFSAMAEAPGGTERLRELILDLAVRGDLVPQDPADQPVDEQLAELWKTVQSSALTRSFEAPPWIIPESWRWVRLKEVADFVPGKTPPTKNSAYWDDSGRGHPWATIGDMPNSGVLLSTERAVSERGLSEVMKRAPAPIGALLMSFKLTIGKVCRVGVPTYFNEAIIMIDTPREATKEYLFRTLPLLSQGGVSKAAIKGSTLNRESITNIPVPFPPLAEQERIVAKVDELMMLCDELQSRQQARATVTTRFRASALHALMNAETDTDLATAWTRVQASWDTLTDRPDAVGDVRHAILELAMRGKLEPQDPREESADRLLERCSLERNQVGQSRKLRLPKNPTPIDQVDKPLALPAGWSWCRFTDVGLLERGRSKHRPRNDPALYVGGTVPLIQTGDVAKASGAITTYTALYNDAGVAQSRLWPEGTLCITIAANIADSALLGFEACFPDSVVGFLPFDCVGGAKWFEFFMRTSKSRLNAFAPSTAQKNINLAILDAVLIPLPPLAEQRRIVAKVDYLMKLSDELEARVRKEVQAAGDLAESAVHHFSG